MTDDQTSEKNALRLIFPEFHVLHAMWRYIWDNKHKVDGKDKLEVYMLFREVCYELNEDEFKGKYELLLSHNLICKNSVLKKHLKDLYDRAPEWALSFRNDLLTRGNNTNNYPEATVGQLKDQVLQRLTAYSLVQLFDFLTTRLEAYFQRRLSMVLNGRQENYWKSKHFVRPSKLVPLRCEKTSHEDLYLVKNLNQNSEYIVDMLHEVCSCPVGRNGAPCKHQMAVVQHYNISSSQFLPVDLQSKLALHKVMTTAPPSAEWYTSLKAGPFEPSQKRKIPDISSVYIEHQATPDDEALNMDLEGNSQPTDNAIVTFDPKKLTDALQNWEAINAHIVNALTSKPEVFVSAVEKFSSKFQKAKESSENQLAIGIAKRKNAGGGRHMTQQGRPNGSIAKKKGKTYGTITTKKKNPALGDCQMTRQGRPPRSKQTAEHGYSHKVAVKEPAWNRIPRKRGPVPHDLSQKITEQNTTKKPRHR
ncbi:Profilin-2 [Frankliniella fusca]|uniref:Profilin-2 n=1 Tax=Frankliniella fusca TaxID=407009 RepID=A0AAE1GW93_9NEOP|nr:Profilin-2 [Frankliniella fusca]